MIAETKENKLKILNQVAYESYQNLDFAKAIVYLQRYIEIDDKNPIIYNFLGYLYKRLSKFENLETQIGYYEKALAIDPKSAQAYRNLALTYPLIERYEDAIKCFHKLFELEYLPDDLVAYGCLMLRLRNFDEGWKYYEYRFEKMLGTTDYPDFEKPMWEGQLITGKTLLVQFEQGFGDTFQFCRYLTLLKPYTDKIIFRVQNELMDLMKLNFPEINVVGMNTQHKDLEFDYHIPLLSILRVLKCQIDDIPLTQGYLRVDDDKKLEYQKEFFDHKKLKIGISWNGAKFGNPVRDVPLKYFYPLTNLENVQVYSFQKNAGYEQIKAVPDNINIMDLGNTFTNFSDTAAAMANLDLFITSDNGVFNLAAAMGIRTCLLLNKHAEWRWFYDDKTTPWYSNVEIFKKKEETDSWSSVMQEVIQNLF